MRVVLATVIGPAGQRDLSLPADTPTAELLPTLVRLLSGSWPRPPGPVPPPSATPPPSTAGPGGAAGGGADPRSAWVLITASGQPLPTWTSLAEHGVLHGERLYLVAHTALPPQLRHLQP